MENKMFCYQCEQTAGCTGCTGNAGVCGKSANTARLQDELTGALIGLARAVEGNEHLVNEEMNQLVLEGLFTTVTNVNFNDETLKILIYKIENEKKKLVPNCFTCSGSCGRNDNFDMNTLWTTDEDVRSLKSLILFGIRGMAAYAYHASVLGYTDETISKFFYKALFAVGMKDWGMDELLPIVLEVGEVNLRCMELLDQANTEAYGNPEITKVNIGVGKNPGILISGHDLKDLEKLGIEVEGEPVGNRYHYHVVERPFELPELKLLVDSIQSSKFITEKKTNTLIKKLEKLVSKYDAQRLQRQVYVSGRIKTMNESIYYTVDAIHNAISENKKIKFQYFQWNVKKEMELRHGGAWYHISPWGLSWDDENYYMIGYDAEAQLIKHYRVDKMLHIRMSDESREGKEHFKKLDMADYAKKSFGMFRGKETSVKMLVNNSLAGVIIDRFGKDVMMIPEDEDHFRVNVDVHVSKQFLGWVFSLGEAVKIIGPDEVVEQMRGEARRLMEQYGE